MDKQTFEIALLVWFFGWGFLMLKCPSQSYRILALGRQPKPSNLKVARVVGIMAIVFEVIDLIELLLKV